ncbi:polyprenyl diphosphate synthase [Thermosipho globiformans]|uniref:polyprenyl diphosphate synthase n=1 Tax=Thermosipho globiformans TaxID=380685 RepID=UPI000F8EA267|nr:polyprenyl diphosphate synthase [Thermosipho globiformans]
MLNHIAFIMDGNGRWAKKQNKPRMYGHFAGAYKIEEVVRWCAEYGVKYTTFYAFSTENWKRPKGEVNFIFGLLQSKIGEFYERMNKEGVRLVFSGRLKELGEKIYNICMEYQEKTKNNDKIVVNMALNYGGRAEIVDAIKKIIDSKINDIDEEKFREFLYFPDIPDPDLIIRTSGEMRLSNFLTWQSAYSELYFTDVLWPDFSREDLDRAIEDFNKRQRRFGGIK